MKRNQRKENRFCAQSTTICVGYKENVEKNIPCTYEEVLANLQERDHRDTHRDVAPLIKVKDAIELAVLLENSYISYETGKTVEIKE